MLVVAEGAICLAARAAMSSPSFEAMTAGVCGGSTQQITLLPPNPRLLPYNNPFWTKVPSCGQLHLTCIRTHVCYHSSLSDIEGNGLASGGCLIHVSMRVVGRLLDSLARILANIDAQGKHLPGWLGTGSTGKAEMEFFAPYY